MIQSNHLTTGTPYLLRLPGEPPRELRLRAKEALNLITYFDFTLRLAELHEYARSMESGVTESYRGALANGVLICSRACTPLAKLDLAGVEQRLPSLLPGLLEPKPAEHYRHYFGSEFFVAGIFLERSLSPAELSPWNRSFFGTHALELFFLLQATGEVHCDLLSELQTKALHHAGYVGCQPEAWQCDLAPVLTALGQPHDIPDTLLVPGDIVLLDPYRRLARFHARSETEVLLLHLVLLPCPKPWLTQLEGQWEPKLGQLKVVGAAEHFLETALPTGTSLIVGEHGEFKQRAQLGLALERIFGDPDYVLTLTDKLAPGEVPVVPDQSALCLALRKGMAAALNRTTPLPAADNDRLRAFLSFEAQYEDSRTRYRVGRPEDVFWPNPVHESHPRSLADTLPFVQRHPLLDRSTPIGSAGSCFAAEISQYLQLNGYRYVVTETIPAPESGVVVDGYSPEDGLTPFCANYGLLFNAPSFSQLAERAFGERGFHPLLFRDQATHTYVDPYREGVYFASAACYDADREVHTTAVRRALETCEVFVVTLGLNECWELWDGTVMSRNPRDNGYFFARHRVLDVQENIDAVERFNDLCLRHNPAFTIILSVSPVPFLATGRGKTHHVVEANSHSKAVLRVAAEELVRRNPNIHYFPSYELVTTCLPQPWADDCRHVNRDAVQRVMQMFETMYLKAETDFTKS